MSLKILLMAVCSGGWRWAMLTTKLYVHSCQQNVQGKAASARCHQCPAHCWQLQELEADGSAGVLSLTFPKGQGES